MESSFFSGSENLYKYMVTIGMLLVAMTVYYPLKEKQELEIQEIELNSQVESLKIKIDENKKDIKVIESKKHDKSHVNNKFSDVKKMHRENRVSQIDSENKFRIIESKQKYIGYYNVIFWIFFPVGILLISYGFFKWYKSKTIDDEKSSLEKTKLELEIKKLENE